MQAETMPWLDRGRSNNSQSELTRKLPLELFRAIETSHPIEATRPNIDNALRNNLVSQISWDNFHQAMFIEQCGQKLLVDQIVITRMTTDLEKIGFRKISRTEFGHSLRAIADENPVNAPQEFLNGLPPWDGVPRVE